MSDVDEDAPLWTEGTVRLRVRLIGRRRYESEALWHPTELDMFKGGRAGLIDYDARRLVRQLRDAIGDLAEATRVELSHWGGSAWVNRNSLIEAASWDELQNAVAEWAVTTDDGLLRREK